MTTLDNFVRAWGYGALIGLAIAPPAYLAYSRIVERWGGRLSAVLLFAARQLRSDQRMFRILRSERLLKRRMAKQQNDVPNNAAGNCGDDNDELSPLKGRTHNVIQFRSAK